MSYHLANLTLRKYGSQNMLQTLDSRVEVLQNWSGSRMAEIRSEASSLSSQLALSDFSSAMDALGSDGLARIKEVFVAQNPLVEEKRATYDPMGDDGYFLVHHHYNAGFRALTSDIGPRDIFLVNSDGLVVYSLLKDDNFGINLLKDSTPDFELANVVRKVLTQKPTDVVVSEFTREYSDPSNTPIVFVAMPVDSATGGSGVLVFELTLKVVNERITHIRSLGETGQSYLIDANGKILTDLRNVPDSERAGVKPPEAPLAAALRGEEAVQTGRGVMGEEVVQAFAPVSLLGVRYAMIVEQATSEMYAPARTLGLSILVSGIAILLLLAALAWAMARSVSKPLALLTKTISDIQNRSHDGERIPGAERGDEVGDIARALDGLRQDLSGAEQVQLEATIQGTAFRTSSAAMMMVDTDFVITYANKALVDLVNARIEDFRKINAGIVAEQLVGKSMDYFHSHPEHQRQVLGNRDNLPYHVEIAVGEGRFALDVNEINLPGKGQLGLVVEWRDVTEIRMNRALLNAMDETQLIIETSSDGKITRANSNLVAALGASLDQLRGRHIQDIVGLESGHGDIWNRLLKLEPIVGRLLLSSPLGKQVIADGSVTAVPDKNNKLMRIVLIANDVTQAQKALEQETERGERLMIEQREVVDSLRVGLKALSTGDLTSRIEREFPFEYEQLRDDFNAAVDNLSMAIQVVIDNAGTIDKEAHEITNAAEDLSDRTEKQAATLEQTAAALDELTVSVSSATSGVMDANRVVKLARESAESSGQIVQQAVAAMGQIEESSRKISRIIGVIDDIAFQTNLLALNAGVEAARAGEAGRGFAVVASEVRALAQRSSEAAREIDGLITTSSNHVRRGVDLVGEAGSALERILASVNDIASRVSEIAASSHEQGIRRLRPIELCGFRSWPELRFFF